MKHHIKSKADSGMIYLIQERGTQEQIEEMLEILGSYIKLAVDIERRILTGGGELHADCEALLLENGSKQAGRYLGSRLVSADAGSRL